MLDDLHARFGLGAITMLADRGLISADKVQALSEGASATSWPQGCTATPMWPPCQASAWAPCTAAGSGRPASGGPGLPGASRTFIELRPVLHWTEARVRAMAICVLAGVIEALVEAHRQAAQVADADDAVASAWALTTSRGAPVRMTFEPGRREARVPCWSHVELKGSRPEQDLRH